MIYSTRSARRPPFPTGRLGALLVAVLSLPACQPVPTAHQPDDPVRIRWSRDPGSLSPLGLANQQAVEGAGLLFMSLLQHVPDSAVAQPFLAEQLPRCAPAGAGRQLITFRLRPEARWDNGQAVTAQDVIASFKFLLAPRVPAEQERPGLTPLLAVEANPATGEVRFLTSNLNPAYAGTLGDIPILAEAVLDPTRSLRAFSLVELRRAAGPAGAALDRVATHYLALRPEREPGHLAGCGPYQLVQWQTDQLLRFQRKPHWWGARLVRPLPSLLARPRELDYVVLPDATAAGLALRRGEIDVFPNVPSALYEKMDHSGPARAQLTLHTTSSYEVFTLCYNTSRPALADAPTRRALARLVNAAQLNQATQLGEGLLTAGLLRPTDARAATGLAPRGFSPEATARELGRAGWQRTAAGWQRGGVLLHLRLTYPSGNQLYEAAALQLRAAAAGIGLPIEPQPLEASVAFERARVGDYDLFFQTIKETPFGVDLRNLLSRAAIGEENFSRFGTPATDALLERIAQAPAPRQGQLLVQLQQLVYEQVPLQPLFFTPLRVAANRQLNGLYLNPMRPGYLANAAYWRPDRGTLAKR